MHTTPKSPSQLRGMFGANLRKLADDHASVSSLARDLGINRTQFNRYLSGESFPRPDVLARICGFFGVDARVLLEPVDQLAGGNGPIAGAFLREFMGQHVQSVREEALPSGFYQFTRRGFVKDVQFVRGLIYVKRADGNTFVRGYEPRVAMAMQGIPPTSQAREYRGFVVRLEDGVAITACRRNGLTASFNYLSRVTSFENNFWVGYVARTVRENSTSMRMTRLVYEHIDTWPRVMEAARQAGYCSLEDLMPFHQRLLQTQDEFR